MSIVQLNDNDNDGKWLSYISFHVLIKSIHVLKIFRNCITLPRYFTVFGIAHTPFYKVTPPGNLNSSNYPHQKVLFPILTTAFDEGIICNAPFLRKHLYVIIKLRLINVYFNFCTHNMVNRLLVEQTFLTIENIKVR